MSDSATFEDIGAKVYPVLFASHFSNFREKGYLTLHRFNFSRVLFVRCIYSFRNNSTGVADPNNLAFQLNQSIFTK